uniref:Bm118 n=1 Tax=Brugia malayi TaxID=6279 RepID=A0A0J9XLM4_BRUMA|nr:Bm118 [Brugia malayi]
MDLARIGRNIYNFRLAYYEKLKGKRTCDGHFLIQSNNQSSINGNIYTEVLFQESNLGEENTVGIGSCNGVSR